MQQLKSGVYKIINTVNNKIYIGSSVNLKKRKREHFHSLIRNKHCNKHLQESFNKHGKSNFKFEIIENVKIEILLIREQYYLDNLNPEYNICKIAGNTLGTKRTPEQLKKLSESHIGQVPWNVGIPKTQKEKDAHSEKMKGKTSPRKGISLNEETKKKISNSKKGKATWSKGKKFSEEYRKKLSNSHLGNFHSQETKKKMSKSNKNKKPVLQFSKNGNFIAEFESFAEVKRKLNIVGVSQVIQGKAKSAGGYIWKLKT